MVALFAFAFANLWLASAVLHASIVELGRYNQGAHFGTPESVRAILFEFPTWIVANWCVNAILAKRLHDRDRSAYWILFFVYVPWVLNLYMFNFARGWTWPIGIANSAGTMISLWGLIEFGFLRGTTGPNRFGSDPLGDNGRTTLTAA
jgi:uncharacterized membrane protein YhaH (DUF805 family)